MYFIWFFIVIFLVLIILSLFYWPVNSVQIKYFRWNMTSANIVIYDPTIEWPFVASSQNQIVVTYSAAVPVPGSISGNPVLINLPSSAKSFSASVGFSSITIPNEILEVILFSSNMVGFRFSPSGQYVTDAMISNVWNILFTVIYNSV